MTVINIDPTVVYQGGFHKSNVVRYLCCEKSLSEALPKNEKARKVSCDNVQHAMTNMSISVSLLVNYSLDFIQQTMSANPNIRKSPEATEQGTNKKEDAIKDEDTSSGSVWRQLGAALVISSASFIQGCSLPTAALSSSALPIIETEAERIAVNAKFEDSESWPRDFAITKNEQYYIGEYARDLFLRRDVSV